MLTSHWNCCSLFILSKLTNVSFVLKCVFCHVFQNPIEISDESDSGVEGAPGDNLSDWCIPETPTKVYTELKTKVKRMSKRGISPLSKRCNPLSDQTGAGASKEIQKSSKKGVSFL